MSSTPNYGFNLKICGTGEIDQVIKRLEEKIDCKNNNNVSQCEFEKHLTDPHAHMEQFDKKVDKKEGCRLICEDELQELHEAIDNRYTKEEIYNRDEIDSLLADKMDASVLNPSGALQIFVAPDGSDLNDGKSIGSPFLTISRANEELQNPNNFKYDSVTVQLAHGQYWEDEVILAGPQRYIALYGDPLNKESVVVFSEQIFIRAGYRGDIVGITATRPSDADLNGHHVRVMPRGEVRNCSFTGNKNHRGVFAGNFDQLYILDSSASNYARAYFAVNLAQMNLLRCSGSNNEIGLYCEAATMFVAESAPGGSAAQYKSRGGQIYS